MLKVYVLLLMICAVRACTYIVSSRVGQQELKAVFPNVTGVVTNTTFANCTEQSGDTRSVVTVSLSGQSVTEIQSGAFATLLNNSAFSAVTQLDLSNNQLIRLEASTFSGLAGLTDAVSLAGNKLRILEPGAFAGLSGLVRLDLSANSLETLEPNTFDELSKLVYLHLEGNVIEHISVGAFERLDSLEYLWLQCSCYRYDWTGRSYCCNQQCSDTPFFQCNKLQSLKVGAFNGLPKLIVLALTGNQLTSLEGGVFSPLVSLQQLEINCGFSMIVGQLSCNRLQHLSAAVFDGLGNLTKLELQGNQLASLEDGVFKPLSQLEYLYLQCQYLAYGYDQSLEVKSCNQLQYLTPGVFSGLDSLQLLDVSGNQLTNLPSGLFGHLPQLRELFAGCSLGERTVTSASQELKDDIIFPVYCNQIATIEAGAFVGLDALNVLGLDGNQLTVLDASTFEGLQALDLSLVLRNNTIDSLAAGTFSHLHNLQQLDLESNRIPHLDASTFIGLSSLKWLRISSNWIVVILQGTWDPLPPTLRFWEEEVGEDEGHLEGGGCVSFSSCQKGADSQVVCKCAADRFSSNFPIETLDGGDLGYCICPAGQAYDSATSMCRQCSVGSYSTHPGSTECTWCNDTHLYAYTNFSGSNSSEDCGTNPQIALARSLIAEELREETLRRDQEEARNTERLTLLITVCGTGLALVLVAFAVFICITKQRKQAVELKLQEAEISLKDATIKDREDENRFLTDWRIKESQITLERELARGAQGTVHLGTLKGRAKKVAVKVSMLEQKVWREAEVAFMMTISHAR